MKVKDLTGQRFGKLTVLGRAGSDIAGACWLCKCDCGNYKIVPRRNLVGGDTRSCGCIRCGRPMENLAGRRFGRLTVIRVVEKDYMNSGHGNALWLCRCDCGQETVVKSSNLKTSHTQSCGCLKSPKIMAEFLAGQAN